ncbi:MULTISPECIES: hypothetical protein [Gammaproteobacteria]|uniref:hypothetical protein n=1 Tax=Gammaproteobacteria TaxID=1236 RepID=UPI000DD0383A|nr:MULTISPECIES: hypothetical protein [Gammaproteobacteria]RTE87433.1 hypothetical protein DQX04_03330 [Aliidiomarina sp. B3213]TCZ92782.1 hypothetical protein EYQ95_01975 [Lysobacter sp. N42]
MTKSKWYKNPEMLIALSALFIGFLTAIISIYSAAIDRQYARAAVWPKLEIFRSFSAHSFSYSVSNRGTGPAIIKYAIVKADTQYIERWSDLDAFSSNVRQSHISTTTMSSGQTIKAIEYSGELASSGIAEVDATLSIELCYCSIYDECWLVDRTNENRPVSQCDATIEHGFEQ